MNTQTPTAPAPAPAVLDVDQAAALLRCEPKTVREHARALGGLKFGRDWVFPAGAMSRRLDEMALATTTPPPAPKPAAIGHAVRTPTTGTRRTRKAPPVLPSI